MITYLDLIQNDDFRSYVEKRIALGTDNPAYLFPKSIPMLYKYRQLNQYAVDDIVKGHITATSIGDFNDLFDGAIHRYGSQDEREKAAENEWEKFEAHRIAAGIPDELLSHDYYVGTLKEHYKTDSRLKFRELDYLGTYVCCFSRQNNSTLMWSHYAANNTGVCIAYDFNEPTTSDLTRKLLLPVAYSNTPIDLRDLLDDESRKIYEYPLDAAVLCAALNKSQVWSYEQEWRMVLVMASESSGTRHLPLNATPNAIFLGYHFLKPFFYYDFKDQQERSVAETQIQKVIELLNYADEQKLAISVMRPKIGDYILEPQPTSAKRLLSFMHRNFAHGEPCDVRYYYTFHDRLMDLLAEDSAD